MYEKICDIKLTNVVTTEQAEAPRSYMDFKKTGQQLRNEFPNDVVEENDKRFRSSIIAKHIVEFCEEISKQEKTQNIDTYDVKKKQ